MTVERKHPTSDDAAAVAAHDLILRWLVVFAAERQGPDFLDELQARVRSSVETVKVDDDLDADTARRLIHECHEEFFADVKSVSGGAV